MLVDGGYYALTLSARVAVAAQVTVVGLAASVSGGRGDFGGSG